MYTTLDPDLQKDANDAIAQNMRWSDSQLDAALVSVVPDDGKIVAMVGGRDYETNKFNLATQMSRQAGSSFKTFTLLSALSEGLDPDNTYIDSSSPVQVGKDWTVNNSEGHGHGSMSVTDATISSVNTVYAQLVHAIGAQKTIDIAHACGIKSELEKDDTVSLGSSGVNPLEMASAYATIANGGYYYEPYAVTEIVDPSGKTVYTHEAEQPQRVLSAAVAQKATDILERVISSGTGTSANLNNGQPCAGKTGTSEHGRDLWFCGFTPQYSTAVWAGYRIERETSMYGGSTCGPIWARLHERGTRRSTHQAIPHDERENQLQAGTHLGLHQGRHDHWRRRRLDAPRRVLEHKQFLDRPKRKFDGRPERPQSRAAPRAE